MSLSNEQIKWMRRENEKCDMAGEDWLNLSDEKIKLMNEDDLIQAMEKIKEENKHLNPGGVGFDPRFKKYLDRAELFITPEE